MLMKFLWAEWHGSLEFTTLQTVRGFLASRYYLATTCFDLVSSNELCEIRQNIMKEFPNFMKCAANRIASTAQHTADVEGYIFDGIDGTQMAFWECRADAKTEEHIHEFDEYFVVVEGCYTINMAGKELRVGAGQECVIRRGTRISGSVVAGTRTIHMFGGHRADRAAESRSG
jgi:mannose-6-phosphate isomerase-like protein (cupin superfamily)